jgi:hypothetical protein
VKRMSYWSELCLGWRCWQVTFCAFYPGQGGAASGEKTLMDLIGDDVVAFKEAVGTEQESAYFRLIVPEGGAAASSTLVAGERKIKETMPGDHAVSNSRIVLPRLCSPGANADDWRFLHQDGEVTGKKQWTFRAESELSAAALPVLKEFLADALALPRGAAYLPEIDPEFEFVTDDLIGRVESWLDFPWTTAIPREAREAFLDKYSVERACKRRRV